MVGWCLQWIFVFYMILCVRLLFYETQSTGWVYFCSLLSFLKFYHSFVLVLICFCLFKYVAMRFDIPRRDLIFLDEIWFSSTRFWFSSTRFLFSSTRFWFSSTRFDIPRRDLIFLDEMFSGNQVFAKVIWIVYKINKNKQDVSKAM